MNAHFTFYDMEIFFKMFDNLSWFFWKLLVEFCWVYSWLGRNLTGTPKQSHLKPVKVQSRAWTMLVIKKHNSSQVSRTSSFLFCLANVWKSLFNCSFLKTIDACIPNDHRPFSKLIKISTNTCSENQEVSFLKIFFLPISMISIFPLLIELVSLILYGAFVLVWTKGDGL